MKLRHASGVCCAKSSREREPEVVWRRTLPVGCGSRLLTVDMTVVEAMRRSSRWGGYGR